MQDLKNKRAPHLTNLNEDTQLSGKLFYSLANLATENFSIGRALDSQIVLRGVGIQNKHATLTIDYYGQISLNVVGQTAYEQTLVNGKHL